MRCYLQGFLGVLFHEFIGIDGQFFHLGFQFLPVICVVSDILLYLGLLKICYSLCLCFLSIFEANNPPMLSLHCTGALKFIHSSLIFPLNLVILIWCPRANRRKPPHSQFRPVIDSMQSSVNVSQGWGFLLKLCCKCLQNSVTSYHNFRWRQIAIWWLTCK